MAILTTPVITRVNQKNQAGDISALTIEEYTGTVEESIERRSVMSPWISHRPVKGTNTITNYAIGETVLTTLVPGEAPEGAPHSFSKLSLTVDTTIMARNIVPILEDFQNNFGARQKLGNEQGKAIAKMKDQSLMIQGIKAARLTDSAYGNGAGKPEGFKGGNKVTLTAAGDELDPAKLFKAFTDLNVLFEDKDIEPQAEDMVAIVRPSTYYAMLQADQIINKDYITSEGTSLKGVPTFAEWGIPVLKSNNLPNTVITGHKLSNAGNGNAYDGDFTKVVALVMSPDALLAGETISLTTDVWFDKLTKQHFIDAYLAFAATPNRAEYAGVIEKA